MPSKLHQDIPQKQSIRRLDHDNKLPEENDN
jgi:hypothetical protein